MSKREVAVDQSEKDRAQAVAGVEANPRFPHGGLARQYRRDRAHRRLQRRIARHELPAVERVREMDDAELARDAVLVAQLRKAQRLRKRLLARRFRLVALA